MVKYTLYVGGKNPLWHDLETFNGKRYQRRNMAFLGLRRAIYEALDGYALRDRKIAHKLMQWAENAEKEMVNKSQYTICNPQTLDIGFTFYLKKE